MEKHVSVLLEEAISSLDIKEDGIYVDMTLGYAGHSSEILKRLKKGFLFAFDKDSDAILASDERLSKISDRYHIFHSGNRNIKECLSSMNVDKVDGILFDLGVSSAEIDEKERGFSYMQDAPLDMRMDKRDKISASDIVNTYSIEDLTRIFREYGEEKHAMRIAKRIEEKRKAGPIKTTMELVDIISSAIPYKDKRNGHPAKKVFQAIRLEVNHELEEFEQALYDSLSLLKVGGVIVVITFHSLEDRICKKCFVKMTEIDPVVKGMPGVDPKLLPDFELITKKPILPTKDEIEKNKRSKSAKMRVIKKIK